jgi:hypothetical protein
MTRPMPLFYVSFYSEFEITGAFFIFVLKLIINSHSNGNLTAILSVQKLF